MAVVAATGGISISRNAACWLTASRGSRSRRRQLRRCRSKDVVGGCGYCEGLRCGPILRRMARRVGADSFVGVTEFVIRTSGLTKRFGSRTAVDQVDLDVPAGCAFGLLGVNGAGKTTLIRMLLGLTPASSGQMWLLGLPVPSQRAQAL